MRMTVSGLACACACAALLLPGAARAQGGAPGMDPALQSGYELWTEAKWSSAFDTLVAYRRSTRKAHNDFVDYLIATSACRCGRGELGRELLESMPYYYALDKDRRDIIARESRNCPPATAVVPVRLTSSGVGPVSSGTRGKFYYVVQQKLGRRYDSKAPGMAVGNLAIAAPVKLPPEELATRLFPPGAADSAVAAARTRLGTGFVVTSAGGFVLASRSHTPAQLTTIGQALEAQRQFYMREFGMPEPPWLVTVYLARDDRDLQALASRLHKLGLGRDAIGYSYIDDFSIAGIIPGMVYGTLKHELFHLMVRNDFTDVPPWLDEGFAALYEVSRLEPGGHVVGLPNWRALVLQELGPGKLSDLLAAPWPAFEGTSEDWVDNAARLQATARYFALYLQERGKLAAVYRSIRDRDALTDGDVRPTAASLAPILGAPLDDPSFAVWLRAAIRRPQP